MIYIELTLSINFILTYLILSLSSLAVKKRARLKWLTAILVSGGMLAGTLFLMNGLCRAVIFVGMITLVCLLSFGYENLKEFATEVLMIAIVTFLFGGACLAFENFVGQLGLFGVLLVAFATYLISRVVLKRQQKKSIIKNFTYRVVLIDGERKIEEEGFLDSGNMLYDTITKKPILLVDYRVFHQIYSDIPLASLITKTVDEKLLKDGHYVRVNSLSAGASILVFSIDEVVIGGNKSVEKAMIGLSLNGFEKGFGKSILLHSAII